MAEQTLHWSVPLNYFCLLGAAPLFCGGGLFAPVHSRPLECLFSMVTLYFDWLHTVLCCDMHTASHEGAHMPAVLLADAVDAVLQWTDSVAQECCPGCVAQRCGPACPPLDQEKAAELMLAAHRAEAAASLHMADRMAAIKEAKADTDKALARMKQESAKAQALVRVSAPLPVPLLATIG